MAVLTILTFISISLLSFNAYANDVDAYVYGDDTKLFIQQDGINNNLSIDIYNYSGEYSSYNFIQLGDDFSYTFSQTCYSTCGVTITQQ